MWFSAFHQLFSIPTSPPGRISRGYHRRTPDALKPSFWQRNRAEDKLGPECFFKRFG